MNFYTVSRATMDIDIVVHLQTDQTNSFLSRLKNFYYNKKTVLDEVGRRGIFNMIDNETGLKVDLFLLKNDEYSCQAFERRVLFNDPGFDIYVISLNDLIIAKLIWIQQLFSDRQAADIRNLMHNNVKDLDYIKFWCSRLKLNTFNLV